MLRVVPGDQHVGLADAEGFAVEFLRRKARPECPVEVAHPFFREQHTAAASRVIDVPDDALAGQRLRVIDQQKIDDEADDLARREMLACRSRLRFPRSAGSGLQTGIPSPTSTDWGRRVEVANCSNTFQRMAASLSRLRCVGEEELVEESIAD